LTAPLMTWGSRPISATPKLGGRVLPHDLVNVARMNYGSTHRPSGARGLDRVEVLARVALIEHRAACSAMTSRKCVREMRPWPGSTRWESSGPIRAMRKLKSPLSGRTPSGAHVLAPGWVARRYADGRVGVAPGQDVARATEGGAGALRDMRNRGHRRVGQPASDARPQPPS
jgi:hypothetical protein